MGWRVELLDKKELDGVLIGGLNLWWVGVAGTLGVHGCTGGKGCLATLEGVRVVELVCVTGTLDVNNEAGRAGG